MLPTAKLKLNHIVLYIITGFNLLKTGKSSHNTAKLKKNQPQILTLYLTFMVYFMAIAREY